MDAAISSRELSQLQAAFPRPTLIDVRRQGAFEQDREVIAGAVKRAVGDAWTWARKSSRHDITTLVAATVAAWAASQRQAVEPFFAFG